MDLQFDCWCSIVSFLCNFNDLSNVMTTCTQLRLCALYCNPRLLINKLSQDTGKWLLNFSNIYSIDFYNQDIKHQELHSFLKLFPFGSKNIQSISLSKIYSIKPDTLHQLMEQCSQFSIGDNELSVCIPRESLSHLRIICFTNCIIDHSALSSLYTSLPNCTEFLSFGGSIFKSSTDSIVEDYQSISIPCTKHRQIVIECTFLNSKDISFMSKIFKNSIIIDLVHDSISCLENIFHSKRLLSSALLPSVFSCHNALNMTPLHLACMDGDFTRTKWLLFRGARLDLKDHKGHTPLHRACKYPPAKHLLSSPPATNTKEYSGDMDININNINKKENTLISEDQQKRQNRNNCAILLIANGADVTLKNHSFETPAYVAAGCGNSFVLKSLLMRAKELHATKETFLDDKKFTLLHAAVMSNSMECCQVLADEGFSPNTPNAYGTTPTHLAYRYGNEEIKSFLQQHGGDISVRDAYGDDANDYISVRKSRKVKC